MARTDLTRIALSGAYAGAMDALTWTAADPTNKNAVDVIGGEILLIRNDDAAAQGVTLTSVADPFGRTADLTESIPAGEYRAFGPVRLEGWRQADGKLYIDAGAATVYFAVLKP